MTTARDFIAANLCTRYAFGLTNRSVAAGLRKLADDFDAGRLLPQSVEFLQDARYEDFAMTTWSLTFRAAICDSPVPEQHELGS